MIKAVIITEENVQDEEYVYPYYRLQEAGYDVQVATRDPNNPVTGKYGVPIRATMSTKDLNADNFDMVLLPGGFAAQDRIRLIPEVISFVTQMNKQNKLIAAICHGSAVLVTAGITAGRNMTAYYSIEVDITNSGAHYVNAPVVIDGNFITSPHYKYNGDFMREVIKYMDNYEAH